MSSKLTMRAGTYVKQPGGYRAFIPKPLPPQPPIRLEGKLRALLSEADMALGRLDGCAETLPNPELFVAMYVYKEAVLSSQIEGTQSTLDDVLKYQVAAAKAAEAKKDIEETVNYVGAVNMGLEMLSESPLSLRMLKAIHKRLLVGVRGGKRQPGEFRKSQNWIGPEGGTLNEAVYVPPPVHEMEQAMHSLEKYIHDASLRRNPLLITCGLVHSQFETIHPFIDGNGRMGRLLITFLLCWRKALKRPLLYLSHYFRKRRQDYYDKLQAVRDLGDWEGWLGFFLEGLLTVSNEAKDTAYDILKLRDKHKELIQQSGRGSPNCFRLLDHLYEQPYFNVSKAKTALDTSYATANNVVTTLEDMGIVTETTGQRRNRIYCYKDYVDILKR